MKDPQIEYYVYNYVDHEFEHTFPSPGEDPEFDLYSIGNITDEITDKMIHQLLEDENADQNPQYEKLYDYLVGYVEGAVGVKFYHSGQ